MPVPQNPFFGRSGLLGESPFPVRRPPYQLGAGPEGFFPPLIAPPELPTAQQPSAGQDEMSLQDLIAAATQAGEQFVPAPETNPMFPSGSPLAQSHPRLAAFLGNFMQGVAASDPQGSLANLLAQRTAQRQAQAALPGQRFEAGLGLADIFEKMRAGRETRQLARAPKYTPFGAGGILQATPGGEASIFREPTPASEPLETVQTPEGPRRLPRSQAAGMPPATAEQAQLAPHIKRETRGGRTYDVAVDRFTGEELWATPSDPTAYQTGSLDLQQQRLGLLERANFIREEVLNIRIAQLEKKGLTPTELGSLSTSLDRITNMRFLLADDPATSQTLDTLQQMIHNMVAEEEQKQQAAPPAATPPKGESSLGFTRQR